MSKNKATLDGKIVGELVGICKISKPLFQRMIEYANQQFQSTLHVDYETDCLVGVAQDYSVYYHVINDLMWSEIDDADHLERAKKTVYPAIVNR